jgi:hypothetical protein
MRAPIPGRALGAGRPGPPVAPAAPTAPALATRLRAKRRPLPLTSTTLAGQIGVEPDELDTALHARPVPPQAAERLAEWATAG